jgi:ribonuclease HI
MEFQAAIEALKFFKTGTDLNIYSDSRLLVDALNFKIEKWQAQDWQEKQRPVFNAEQFKKIYELKKLHIINWHWIKAHSSNKYNDRCDELCILARSR